MFPSLKIKNLKARFFNNLLLKTRVMIKLSIVVRKNAGKLETLYIGEDCGKAIAEYKAAKGKCYIFEKVRHTRCKDTKFIEQTEPMPKRKAS